MWYMVIFCWVAGGMPGSVHDLTLSHTLGIVQCSHLLNTNEVVLADKGYIGENIFLTPFKSPTNDVEEGWNSFINCICIIVKYSLTHLKGFTRLSTKWRHDIGLHSAVFHVISQIVNIDLCFCPGHKTNFLVFY